MTGTAPIDGQQPFFDSENPVYNPPVEPLEILHRDNGFIVLNKPSGLLHVPGRDPRLSDCLHRRAQALFPGASVIHRLDLDTSGVVVMGLNKQAHANIAMQFEQRTVLKTYIARVWGTMAEDSGHVDLPLASDPERKPRHRVDFANGRPARTDWQVIDREPDATRIRLTPLTGRTHQLRVHMLALGHPILGDRFYASGDALAAAPRLQLHAESLTFTHPDTGATCHFTAPCGF